jgi:hypothetical protein
MMAPSARIDERVFRLVAWLASPSDPTTWPPASELASALSVGQLAVEEALVRLREAGYLSDEDDAAC